MRFTDVTGITATQRYLEVSPSCPVRHSIRCLASGPRRGSVGRTSTVMPILPSTKTASGGRSTSAARRFSCVCTGARTDEPSLDLLIKQAGEFDPAARKLRLDWLNQVVERRRPVVTLSLDSATDAEFGARARKGNTSKTGESSEPITLGLE